MCVGVAILFGPPTLLACCYATFFAGQNAVTRQLGVAAPPLTFAAAGTGVGTLVGAYKLQKKVLICHFDEGGRLSLDFKKGVESLGEPMQIKTWQQFYRASGPPVFARVSAVVVSCFVAGVVHTSVGHQITK
mmetsp:Transcript_40022/g.55623  ORF Transcript_40022/g.55623 Transcript_40022/m.55623 type:complete len:132 (+) Transcript_40022:114-509(+)